MAHFEGEVRVEWLRHGGEDRMMKLLEEFVFVDDRGVRWVAPTGSIIDGASVNTPVMLRVRARLTKHGGQDIDAPNEWMAWFDNGSESVAARDGALFAEREVPREEDGDLLWA